MVNLLVRSTLVGTLLDDVVWLHMDPDLGTQKMMEGSLHEVISSQSYLQLNEKITT